MRPRIIYRRMENDQIRQLNEHEANLHFKNGESADWDAPIIDTKSMEIIFKCTLRSKHEY